jgi:hypothetical protein
LCEGCEDTESTGIAHGGCEFRIANPLHAALDYWNYMADMVSRVGMKLVCVGIILFIPSAWVSFVLNGMMTVLVKEWTGLEGL